MSGSTGDRRIISEACDLMEQWTGFSLRETRPRRIANIFHQRAEQRGFDDPIAYLEVLGDLSPTADEPQRLVNLITNGLTAFWRDAPQLSALRSILNHLHVPSQIHPIQVWCAGVSTGEEAYTVSMVADEESIPVDVLGTDVNTDFLKTARRGVYSDWSLRRLDPSRRHSYLRPIDGNHWRVDHPSFERVHFQHHNLLESPPASSHPDGRWDIILCRNVLIYFSSTAMTATLRHLAEALSDDGYLMFGSSEQIHPEQLGDDVPNFRPIRKGGGFLYRPGKRRTGQTIEPGSWHVDDDFPTSDPPSATDERLDEVTSDVTTSGTVAELIDATAQHLESGDMELALASLEAALGYDPFQVECHCLMGTLLQTLGADTEAIDAFQKALFLEPDHWFAAHRTATIYESHGDTEHARRAHRRTLDGLRTSSSPVQNTRLLNSLVDPTGQLHHQAQRRAEEFLRLHGLDT